MTSLRRWLPYALTLAGSVGFFLMQLSVGQASQPAAVSAAVFKGEPGRNSSGQIEPLVLAAAKETQIRKIFSVLKRPDGKLIELEWESDPPSTLRFVDELQRRGVVGACKQLRVSAANSTSAFVRSHAIFSLANGPDHRMEYSLTGPSRPLNSSTGGRDGPSLARETPLKVSIRPDVFARSKPVSLQRPQVARLPTQARASAALMAARLKEEEAEQLEAKRRELESRLKLTGIVNRGRETLAFMSLEGPENKSLIVRVGDMFQEARVVSIDERKNEVRLDYAGKLEVLVKLKSPQGQ